jgi:hypothetical protein
MKSTQFQSEMELISSNSGVTPTSSDRYRPQSMNMRYKSSHLGAHDELMLEALSPSKKLTPKF